MLGERRISASIESQTMPDDLEREFTRIEQPGYFRKPDPPLKLLSLILLGFAEWRAQHR
jgi:hypothetical protein